MTPIFTPRLELRPLQLEDAAFILELLNEPGFIQNIGDKDVRDLNDALRYIEAGPQASYAAHGHGLLLTALRDSGEPVGICGLVKRDALPHPDIGYAFLQRHWGQGYATESAAAALRDAKARLGIDYVVGITAPDNAASCRVLVKLGLADQGLIELDGIDGPSRYFAPAVG